MPAANRCVEPRRYLFKLYPTADQAAVLHEHRRMVADLWNALLQRWEDVQRRTQQRQIWHDAAGKRHRGLSVHHPEWPSQCLRAGIVRIMPPDKNGRPRTMSAYDLQNEVTYMVNQLPEWRALSVWTALRTAALLIRAIEAFMSRAAAGKGRAAGYPRFKRRDQHNGVPHRFASGCDLRQLPGSERGWQLRLKGVPGVIRARGRLPALAAGSRRLKHDAPVAVEKWTDADVIWRDGAWWLSVAVEIERTRLAGRRPLTVQFGLVGEFAMVDGIADTPSGVDWLFAAQDRLDRLKAGSDARWPRGRRREPAAEDEYHAAGVAIRSLAAKIARYRRNLLHVWTTQLVERAAALTIIAPEIKQHTRSGRGNAENWGAAVDVVAALNRSTLGLAPAMAIGMLEYKAREAGILCEVVDDFAPPLAISRTLIAAAKAQRSLRREIGKQRREAV